MYIKKKKTHIMSSKTVIVKKRKENIKTPSLKML